MKQISLKESSNIAAAYYNKNNLLLQVDFISGSTYLYEDVPYQVIERWMEAESVGQYFNKHIRSANYRYSRLDKPQKVAV